MSYQLPGVYKLNRERVLQEGTAGNGTMIETVRPGDYVTVLMEANNNPSFCAWVCVTTRGNIGTLSYYGLKNQTNKETFHYVFKPLDEPTPPT